MSSEKKPKRKSYERTPEMRERMSIASKSRWAEKDRPPPISSAERSRQWREQNPGAWTEWHERLSAERKAKHAERERKHRAANKEMYAAKMKARYHAARKSVFELFGNKCKRCGFADERALQIDHVEGLGVSTEKRLRMGETGLVLYLALIDGRRDLSKYQLLCANCNWIKRHENNEVVGYKNAKAQKIPN